jgi:hypothetical protein
MTHPTSREIPIEPSHTALLFVDVGPFARLRQLVWSAACVLGPPS